MPNKKKKKKKPKRRKGKTGRGSRRGRKGQDSTPAVDARSKVLNNYEFLFEHILEYLNWQPPDKNHLYPGYACVNKWLKDICLRAAAYEYRAFDYWFTLCCDARTGFFTFNATSKAECFFQNLLWKNRFNDEHFDDIIEGCRSNCFGSTKNCHQRIKSRRRNYAMLKLFQLVANQQLLGHALLKFAYHLVGQWMVFHVKDWQSEVKKVGFFKQLRELFFWWARAEKLGCKSTLKAKLGVFLVFTDTLYGDKTIKKNCVKSCVYI